MVAKVYLLELFHGVFEHLLLKATLVNLVRRPYMECYNHSDRLRKIYRHILNVELNVKSLPRRSDIESKNSQGASGNSPALTNET